MLVRLGGGQVPGRDNNGASDLDEPRFGMLETLHEYALAELEAAGEREAAERAHAEWCLDLARSAQSALWGPEQGAWLDRIERELPNLRSAMRRLLDSGRDEPAGDIAAGLERFWLVRGHLAEGRDWLEQALASADHGASRGRAGALSVAAMLASYGGDPTSGVLAGHALETARTCGAQEALALALCAVGLVARGRGDFAQGNARFEEAIEILRTLDRPARLAETLTRFAAGELWHGDFAASTTHAAEAVELSRQAGDTEGWLDASGVFALALVPEDEQRAASVIADVLKTYRAVGARRSTSRGLHVRGVLSLRTGDYARARAELEEACAIASEFGYRGFLAAVCVPSLARVHLQAGHPDDAARLLAAADQALATVGGSIPPWMRADEGGGVDAMRAALADPRYEAARAEGATLSLDEALAAAARPDAATETGDDEVLQALTPRELEVLRLITRELTDTEIAQELVLSRRTVHAHLRSIYRKLDVGSRVAAARWAAAHSVAS